MATAIQLLRSSVPSLRPEPEQLLDGMPMVNLHEDDPGLYFKLSDNTIGKVGNVKVGNKPPNASPALTPGNSIGEGWFDTTDPLNPVLKIWVGTEWVVVGRSLYDIEGNEIPILGSDGEWHGYAGFSYNPGTEEFQSLGDNTLGDGCDDTLTVNSTADFKCETRFRGEVTFDEQIVFPNPLEIAGDLHVKGNTVLGDNLPGNCSDTLTIQSVTTFSCPSTFNKDIEIVSDVTHTGDTTQTGDFNLTGDLTIDGDLNLSGGFDIGDVNNPCTGTFNVYNDSDFACGVALSNATKTLTVAGASTFNNTVDIVGNSTVTGTFDVTGNSTVAGTFDVTGNTSVTGTFDVTGDTTLVGAYDLTGDSTIEGNITQTGNTAITGNLSATGNIVLGTAGQCATHSITMGNKVFSECNIEVGGSAGNGNVTIGSSGNIDLEGTLDAVTGINVGASDEIVLDGATGNITTSGGTVTAQYFAGDGSQLTNLNIPGSMTFQGSIDCTVDAAPGGASSGDFYMNTGAGTVVASWTGIAGQTIAQDQFVYYGSDGNWSMSSAASGGTFVTVATAQTVTGAKTFSAAAEFGSTVEVDGNLTAESDVELGTSSTDALTVNATSTFNAGVTAGTTLEVTGATTLSSTLDVTGAATLSSTLAVTDAATLNSTLQVVGNTSLGGTLGVTGATTLSSTLAVTDATTLSSTLGVTGATTLSSTLDVTGATTLSSTLNVTDATTLSSTLAVTGATTLSSTLAVTGEATCSTATTANSGATVLVTKGYLDTLFPDFSDNNGATLDTRYVNVTGDNMSGNLTLGTDKVILNATNGNSSFAGTLNVTGATTLSSTLTTVGNTSLQGELAVTGASALSSTLQVTGAATMLSTLDVTGNLSVNTDKFTVVAASGNTNVAGTLNSAGNFSVATDKFTVDTSGNVAHEGNLTINTDKATVTAATGAATFAAGGCVINQQGRVLVKRTDGLDTVQAFEVQNSSGTSTVLINGNGSASFANVVKVGDYDNTVGSLVSPNGGCTVKRDSDGTFFRGLYQGNEKFKVEQDGSVTFAGGADFGGVDLSSTSASGQHLDKDGWMAIQRPDGNTGAGLEIYAGTSQNAVIRADGSATFNGSVKLAGDINNKPAVFATSNATDAILDIRGTSGKAIGIYGDNTYGADNLKITLNYDGSATFASTIQNGNNTGIAGSGQGWNFRSGGFGYQFVAPGEGTDVVFEQRMGDVLVHSMTRGGSATFAAPVQVGNKPTDGANAGARISSNGPIEVARGDGQNEIWKGYLVGTSTPTSSITAGGSATFVGGGTFGSTTKIFDTSGGRNVTAGLCRSNSGQSYGLTIAPADDENNFTAFIKADGSATFAGTVTVGGSSSFTGNIEPKTDGGADLGSTTKRFANLYTQDMHFSNEGTEGNSVDGTTGDWTLQEGDENLYFINNKTGMKFRVVMEAV